MTKTAFERIKTQAVGQHKAMLLDIPEVAEFAAIAAVRSNIKTARRAILKMVGINARHLIAQDVEDVLLAEFPEARESA